jgi:AraC-like DNA-binding protein
MLGFSQVLVAARRRVDWPVILGADAPTPAMVTSPVQEELAEVLSACDELLELDDADTILRRAVELARERLGLARAAIFLLDAQRKLMLGTWGTDLDGKTVDEHHVMYDFGDNDREVFRRAAEEGLRYTAMENCPIVVQLPTETRVVGRGWVVCTAIRSARGDIGMMFNDAGHTHAAFDQATQGRVAILCSVLGTILELCHGKPGPREVGAGASASHPLVGSVVRMLAKDPSLTGRELAPKLDISPSRLARVFKGAMGMSLVDYRNRLRLERFQVLVDAGGENLLDAALAAGFGSYAQFHRVFRALRGTTPRDYLRERGAPRQSEHKPS